MWCYFSKRSLDAVTYSNQALRSFNVAYYELESGPSAGTSFSEPEGSNRSAIVKNFKSQIAVEDMNYEKCLLAIDQLKQHKLLIGAP